MKTETLVIRNRVLVKALTSDSLSEGGIIIPASAEASRAVMTGYVMKYGEGYPQYDPEVEVKVYTDRKEKVYYIPLKIQLGDLIFFYKDAGAEIYLDGARHYVISENDILLIRRQSMDIH